MSKDRELERAENLIEALPYMNKFKKKIFVIKLEDSILEDEGLLDQTMQDIALLQAIGVKLVLVNGLSRKKTAPEDQEKTGQGLLRKLSRTNLCMVRMLNKSGARAIGITCEDAGLFRTSAMKLDKNPAIADSKASGPKADVKKDVLDEEPGTAAVEYASIEDIDDFLIDALLKDKIIPVLNPVALSDGDEVYPMDADKAAKEIAIRLQAEKLIFLINRDGIVDKNDELHKSMTVMEARELINSGALKDRKMKASIEDSIYTLARGVEKVHFVDGKRAHGLILELFTDKGIGTEIYIKKL